jgi:LPS-assembly protein
MKFSALGLAVLCTAAALARAEEPAAKPADSLEVLSADAQGQFDFKDGVATAQHGVIVTYLGSTLTAQKVTFDQAGRTALAEGDVTIVRAEKSGHTQLFRGARARYDFVAKAVVADDFRLGQPPFFIAGARLSGGETNTVQVVKDALLTTDDLAEPGYHIRARSLTIVNGKTFTAREATLYFGEVPVMYFPTYSRSLERHPNYWTTTPGYRSLYGPFALNSYHYFWSTNVETALNLDWRQKRGVGVGPELNYDLGKWGRGNAEFYYAHDNTPGTNTLGQPIAADRHFTTFTHQMEPWEDASFKAVVREQSDPLVVHDFFEHEYRRDTQPKTFFEASQFWRNFSLDAIAQPQVNGFFQTVERLPDVKLTGLRQQIGETPLYYESESSLAYLSFRQGLIANGTTPTNYSAFRADTFQQIVLPETFFGWLNFTPRIGGRFTHYGDITGVPGLKDDLDREVLNTGAEVSFKAARVWPGLRNELLDTDGLRHIVEPSINYAYVPRPNVLPYRIPQFDGELPSQQLLPLTFPDYNSIDSVDSQNTLRFGLRNKLQTKRGGQVENLLNWSLFTDWRLRPNAGQTTFPDLYSDFDFSPRRWIILNSQVRYDINGRQWREANHRLTLQPNDTWNWSVGHRYIVDDPLTYGLGNNLFSSSLYYRINEDWGFRLSHYFEARDGVMQEQDYTIYRDLRSWTAALTLRLRDNGTAGKDWTVALTLQLKAFPRFALGKDTDHADWLLGR